MGLLFDRNLRQLIDGGLTPKVTEERTFIRSPGGIAPLTPPAPAPVPTTPIADAPQKNLGGGPLTFGANESFAESFSQEEEVGIPGDTSERFGLLAIVAAVGSVIFL